MWTHLQAQVQLDETCQNRMRPSSNFQLYLVLLQGFSSPPVPAALRNKSWRSYRLVKRKHNLHTPTGLSFFLFFLFCFRNSLCGCTGTGWISACLNLPRSILDCFRQIWPYRSSVLFSFTGKYRTIPFPPGSEGNRFPCPQCDRSYKHHSNLKRHMKIECQKPPTYVCAKCDYATYYQRDLNIHSKVRHGGRK